MTGLDSLTSTEWSVVLDGNLGSQGSHLEMDGLDEVLARVRLESWRRHRPDVTAVLRWRERRVVVGDWSQVEP